MQATINAVPGRAVPRKSRRRRQYLVRPPQSRDLGPQTLQLRHRVLGRLLGLRRAPPRSLATCSIALVSDECEPRDSVNSLTAFALNSGVYLVPFAMVPSSPIELGKCGTKISSYQVVMESMTSPTKWHQPHILMYKVDTFVMGDDWKGKFDSLTDICNVVYLPRTPEISTTKIKHDLDIIHQDTQS